MLNMKKITTAFVLVLAIVISITVFSPYFSNPANHTHSLEKIDEKIEQVMVLSSISVGASAVLSLIPDDTCTPIANQLSEFAKYFLLILSALYLEKYLVMLSGTITFTVLIPLAIIFWSYAILVKNTFRSDIAFKTTVIGLILVFIVPASVLLSDSIYQTQESIVENTINESEELGLSSVESSSFWDQLGSTASDIADRAAALASHLLESLAIMIVTTCLIPLLVFVFLVWMIKTIFGRNVVRLETKNDGSVTSHQK